MLLFVYGSLMYGFALHFYLKHAHFVGRGFIKGYTLYNLGFYPCIVHGTGKVFGEVYEVNNKTLAAIDKVEGVDDQVPSMGLYIRESTTAYFDDYKEEVETYVYNQPLPKNSKLIESGDYLRYIGSGGKINYFAYGANTNIRRMNERGIKIISMYAAKLFGYSLKFNKKCDSSCCANIERDHDGVTYGVLYQLPFFALHELDRFEGYPKHYIRRVVRVEVNKKIAYAETYIANSDYITENCTPNSDYLRFVIRGLREIGWVDEAKRLEKMYIS